MELRHLRYFIAIAEHASFRAAAEELFVSQPTLSQQMKDLEKELGCDLFERAGRGIRLTGEGSVFFQYARKALNVLDEGQAAVDEFDELLRGRLRVGVVQTVGAYLIPKVVSQFSRDFPAVEVRVAESSASQIESGLHDGSLDIAVSFEPVGQRTLSHEVLFDEQFVLIVDKRHAFANRKKVRVVDLNETPLCILTRDYCTRRMVDAAFLDASVSPTVAIEMTSVEGCLGVVESGGPAAILPHLALSKRMLHAVRIERPVIKRSVCLIRRNSLGESRASEAFSGLVREAAVDIS